jgi:hypothetical protein
MNALLLSGCACLFAVTAVAQSFQEWTVTVQQTAGNDRLCVLGSRGGIVRVEDDMMTLEFPNVTIPGPLWRAKLAPDGRFDGEAEGLTIKANMRLTIPAGTGPREIKMIRLRQNCSYRIIPN